MHGYTGAMYAPNLFSADHPPCSWAERFSSFAPGANVLWDIMSALDALDVFGARQHKPRHARSGLPCFTEAELEKFIATCDDKSALKRMWREKNPSVRHCYQSVYDTGYAGSRAFDNAVPAAPISLLVCPTRPAFTFEHYIEETPAQEIGEFFKSVLHTARIATDEADARISNDSTLSARRDFYEKTFDAIRNGERQVTPEQLTQLASDYMRESHELEFAIRDPRTGRSGFRIGINNGTGVAGMSQAHFHVQILGGRYLGAMASRNPLVTETPWEKEKLGTSLTR